MPRVRLAAVPLLAVLLPLTASALGLGEISLRSALNQPFVAVIPVTSDSAEELAGLQVQLAPVATFQRFGLDRPGFLGDLRFQVEREGQGTVIRITSAQPVSEPFISILLDAVWPQGRLLREYTVLLDPPTFARPDPSGRAAARPVQAPPVAAGPSAATPAIQRAPADSAARVTSTPDGDTYGPVRSNETLWRISERLSAEGGASLNQMMVALYRANPEAFAGNINRLRRGAILRVPRGGELADISAREAGAEVRRQNDEWRTPVQPTPAAAPARLQLVPPTVQPDAAGGSPAATSGSVPERAALERELAEKQRLLSLKDSQLKALQDRLSELEGGKRAAETAPPAVTPDADASLDAGAGAAAEVADAEVADAEVADAEVADAEVADIEPPVAATPAVEERKLAKQPARERKPDGGILATLGGLIFNVWFLVSAAAVLLAGLFFVFARRRMETADHGTRGFDNDLRGGMLGAGSTQPVVRRDDYSVVEVPGDRAAPKRHTGGDPDAETPLERTISTEGAVELDQADVVAEAEFHMAYGLYDQAAELLMRALRDSPDRRDLRLKLLEVYFIWENKAAFLKEAQTFQRQLNGAADPAWNKVVIMGKQICPGEALFAGAVASSGDASLDLALDEDSAGGVDFAFDDGDSENVDLDLTAAPQGPAGDILDFDLGLSDEESAGDRALGDTGVMKAGSTQATTEVPTIEAPRPGDYSSTMETPTIESRGLSETTQETPTLESAVPGLSAGAVDPLGSAGVDQTEEINLEDLGLDLTGLDQAAGDLGTGIHAVAEDAAGDGSSLNDDYYDLSADDDDASDLLQGLEGDLTAEMRGMALDEGTLDLPAFGNALEKSGGGRKGAGASAGDTAEHRALDDTAEQPRTSATGLGEMSAELSKVDFDIGEGESEDLAPTSVMTGRRRGPEGPTMTEVGTKLDLARAYVDMGDPDGARSILNEVLEEGDSAQRQEARRLLDDLSD